MNELSAEKDSQSAHSDNFLKIIGRTLFNEDNFVITAFVSVLVIAIAIILIAINVAPVYTTRAEVISVGYEGVTVKHIDKYGGETTHTASTNDPSRYKKGDTVTISIKWDNSFLLPTKVWIVE